MRNIMWFVWVLCHINLFSYLMANPFLYKLTVLFQFSIITQFNCRKHFYFKLLSLVKQFKFKQLSLASVRSFHVKTALFQTVQFSISTPFSSV